MGQFIRWAVAVAIAAVAMDQAVADMTALDFLVGSCWRGEIGADRVDTHCYEHQYAGQFVRDRHAVEGGESPYEGETLYYSEPATGQLGYLYWASSGVVERGQVIVEDAALVFPSVAMTEHGEIELRTVVRRLGDDCYENVTERKKEGGWATWWQARYCRVRGDRR